MAEAEAILGPRDLAEGLAALGVASGDGLFVHSSLRAIGHVLGGPRGLIEALIAAVGPDGLIAMPGFSRDAYDPTSPLAPVGEIDETRARIREQVQGYDRRLSNVRQNGAVAEAFRSWPGGVRSPHPTSSVLLWGGDAETYAAPHDPDGWATGPATPWGRLAERPAMKILLIGVGWNRCSALHAAESQARHRRCVTRSIKLGPGPEGRWIEAPDVADDLGRLFPAAGAAWEATGAVSLGLLGGAETRLCSYAGLLAFARDWLDRRNAADGEPPVDGV